MRIFALTIVLFIGMAIALNASAQSQPRRVELIVPARQGGNLDKLGRIVAAGLTKSTSRKFMVTNRPGRWLESAIKRGGFSKTDGSQLAIVSTSNYLATSILPKKIKPTPIAMIGRRELAMFVLDSSKIKSLEDFKKNTSKIVVVGATNVVSKSAALRTFGKLGVPIRFGGAQAIYICIRKPSNCALDAVIMPARMYQGFKGVTVFSTKAWKTKEHGVIRSTFDQGVPVAASIAYGIIGPPKLSKPVIQYISNGLGKLAKRPDFQKDLKSFGIQPEYRDRKEFRRQLELLLVKTNYCEFCDCKGSERCRRTCSQCK